MTSAIAAVSRREGSRASVSQYSGQPLSFCGQRPWRVKPRRVPGALRLVPGALGRAPARGPGQGEEPVVEGLPGRCGRLCGRRGGDEQGEDRRKGLYHRGASALYNPAYSPRKPTFAPRRTRVFGSGKACLDERNRHGAPTDAEGDRRLAGREHHAHLPADRRVLRPARARGERHRRRRGGAGDQGLRPDGQPPADRRGDQEGRKATRRIASSSTTTRPPRARRSARGRATPRSPSARTGRRRSPGWSSSTPSSRTGRSPSSSAPPSRRSSRSATAATGTSSTSRRSTRWRSASASRASSTRRWRRR